jgi:hypothetical protein
MIHDTDCQHKHGTSIGRSGGKLRRIHDHSAITTDHKMPSPTKFSGYLVSSVQSGHPVACTSLFKPLLGRIYTHARDAVVLIASFPSKHLRACHRQGSETGLKARGMLEGVGALARKGQRMARGETNF